MELSIILADIKRTTAAIVKKLMQIGILKETTNAARNRVFSYEKYISILRKDT